MQFFFTNSKWLWLLIVAGACGCQRASYQFQPVAGAAYQVVPPAVSLAESALVTATAPPISPPSERRMPAAWPHAHQRSARHQQTRRALVFSARARSAVAAIVAAPTHRQRPEPGPVAEPVHYRSQGIALLLAALSLTYLPLSLHNFYLGYYGRGIAAIALVIVGTYLVVLSFFASFFSGAGLVGLGILGLAMLGGWFVWQIADLVRIITKDLKPKNGEYTSRFLQTSPDAHSTPTPRTD